MHWLPVSPSNDFEVLLLVFKALKDLKAPAYITFAFNRGVLSLKQRKKRMLIVTILPQESIAKRKVL